MNLSTVMRRIPTWYAARKSIYIRSAPGRGKSTVIGRTPELLAKAFTGKKFGIVIINGGMLTPMHMLGFGVPKHETDHSHMLFTDPFFWLTDEGKRLDEYDGGIIFVDEEDKADVDVKKVLGEGRLSGRFGPHILPAGWIVWGAGNRVGDRSGSTKELDHLINRRMEIDIADDLESLLHWQTQNGCLPVTVAFTNANPHVVFTEGVPDKQGPWCTPRSLAAADATLRAELELNGELDADYLAEEIAGEIGQAATAQLMSFIKLDREMPKFENIVRDPEGERIPPETAPDARMLICYNLAHRVTKETISSVIKYVDRLPAPFAVSFARAACNRLPILALSPAMQAWSQKHNSLMLLLHSLGK